MIRKFPILSTYTIPFLTPSGSVMSACSDIATKLNTFSENVKFEAISCEKDLDSTIIALFQKFKFKTGQPFLSCGFSSNEYSNSNTIHSAITSPNLLDSKVSPDYVNIFPSNFRDQYSVIAVRPITPNPNGTRIRPKDRVDVFPSQGIDSSEEEQMLSESFKKTATVINDLLETYQSKKVYIVTKKLSRIDNLNRIYESSFIKYIHSANVEVRMISSSTAYNQLTMFPEKYKGIYLVNDTSNSLVFEQVLTGLAGGRALNFTKYVGQVKNEVSFYLCSAKTGPENPIPIISAAASVMYTLGSCNSAQNLLGKLKKSIERNQRNHPNEHITRDIGKFLDEI